MNRVRLLPIVIVAASGLFILKATELVSTGDRLLTAEAPQKPLASADDLSRFGRAIVRHRNGEPPESDFTGSVAGRKDAKKDESKPDSGPKVAEARPAEPLPPSPASASERAVLERLQERRGAIDERAREMEMRENLLQAAERKLDGRINDLREIEGRLDAGARAERAEIERQLKTVVTMYETMKAKDAARVFDRLKLDVLVPIATAMKPARMAEIMAAMSPEAAERLTVALATKSLEARAGQPPAASAAPPGELPRLDAAQGALRR